MQKNQTSRHQALQEGVLEKHCTKFLSSFICLFVFQIGCASTSINKNHPLVDQTNGIRVYFMRLSNFNGSLYRIDISLNDQLLLSLANACYAVVNLRSGKYEMTVSNTIPDSKFGKVLDRYYTLDLTEGKTTYIMLIQEKQKFWNILGDMAVGEVYGKRNMSHPGEGYVAQPVSQDSAIVLSRDLKAIVDDPSQLLIQTKK